MSWQEEIDELNRRHAIADPGSFDEFMALLQALASPFVTAESTGQDIIDPRTMRRNTSRRNE